MSGLPSDGTPRRKAVQAAILIAMLLPAMVSGQTTSCDPDLPSSLAHPYGYRVRGDRCEGIYIQEVALATLLVASFTESYEGFDPHQGQDLQLDWVSPRAAEVRIRAQGIEPRLYFRMDAVRAAGTTSYRWPTGLLAGLGIGKQKLGVSAWTEQRFGNEVRRVYLPLRIRQWQQPVSSGHYELLLVPGRELKEVYVHLAGLRDDGTSFPAILSGQPLGRGYYPARRAIPIQIPRPKTPGLYSVELAAELTGGAIVTTSICFHHGG